MSFTGFQTQYPEYEVITPQTKKSFTLRSLTVQEEEKLKGSLVTPTKIAEHLNTCIFQSVVKKPDEIEDLDSFLKNITLKDRDALLYGLYHITYEEIRNYEVKCTKCSSGYQVTVQASSTFNFNSYPKDDVLTSRIKVKLPISKGVTAVIKQPTLIDEMLSIRNLASRPGSSLEIITETLILDRFEQELEDKTEPRVYSDRSDVLDAYLSLPAKDKRSIFKAYEENFGKYGVDLKMRSFCSSCGNEDNFDIDLVDSFFRSLYEA